MSVMDASEVPRRTRRRFSKTFKADAVSLVLDEDRKINDVASSLGIGEQGEAHYRSICKTSHSPSNIQCTEIGIRLVSGMTIRRSSRWRRMRPLRLLPDLRY